MPHISADMSRCVGCRYCMLHCSLVKEGMVQPAVSRIRVSRNEGTGEEALHVCQQCPDAPCVEVCPTEALKNNEKAGQVDYHRKLCTVCGLCVNECPFQAIFLSPDGDGVLKCDLCRGQPACIPGCPVAALEVT